MVQTYRSGIDQGSQYKQDFKKRFFMKETAPGTAPNMASNQS